MGRGGTYELSEGVALIALLLEREAREATVRRLLSVEPDLGSTPETRELREGVERPEQPRANGIHPYRERPGQVGYLGCVFWS